VNPGADETIVNDPHVFHVQPQLGSRGDSVVWRLGWEQGEVKVGPLTPGDLGVMAAVPRIVFRLVEPRFERHPHEVPIEQDRLS